MRTQSKLREAVRFAEKMLEFSRNTGIDLGEKQIQFAAFILGAEGAWGAYRGVFILDDCVVKFPKYSYRTREMESEATFINQLRKSARFKRHFPRTRYLSNGVMLQEKCDVNDELYDEFSNSIAALARRLGVMQDLHHGNVGWRYEKNGPVPVFIDVEFRDGDFAPVDPKQRRSWEV